MPSVGRQRRWLLLLVGLAIGLVSFIAFLWIAMFPYGLTKSTFNRIQEGMTQKQVEDLLKHDLKGSFSWSSSGQYSPKNVFYTAPSRGHIPSPTIEVRFVEGKVTRKEYREPSASELLEGLLITLRVKKQPVQIPRVPDL